MNITNKRLPGRLVIGHIRYATVGKVNYYNTHPFIREINNEEWVFAHNGTVEAPQFGELLIASEGQSDSENIFCYIQQELIEKGKTLSLADKIVILEEAIMVLSKYGKLNLLFSDGTYLFVHTNYRESLYRYKSKGIACFSTIPLNRSIEIRRWEPVELNRLLIYKDGEKIYQGLKHNNLFRYNKKAIFRGGI